MYDARMDHAPMDGAPLRFRTLWISDVHLGTKDSKAEALLDFLRATESDTLYVVGDLIDGWQMRRRWHWPQTHNDVVQKLLRKVRKGTRVVFVPGNHDGFARAYAGLDFGGIEVRLDALHDTADGRRLLVLHGDAFDGVVALAPWLSHVGSWAYVAVLRLNRPVNRLRRALALPYWSLSAALKRRAKRAVQYVADFEAAVADEAARRGVDGVVCGHIHCAEIRTLGAVTYYNCGDWVESCTALAEHFDGRLDLLTWPLAPAAPSAHGDGQAGVPAPLLAVRSSSERPPQASPLGKLSEALR